MSRTLDELRAEIDALHKAGTYKHMPVIDGAMGAAVRLDDGREVVNFCSNNYLGLANHPEVLDGARKAIDRYGHGTASVRFICGTFSLHLELEEAIADFFGMERATTYVSCWNANEALVPTLLGEGDVVISDELNHASIIDAIRLRSKKTQRMIYKHSDMADLARRLDEAKEYNHKLIFTDGVFSMEGDLAKLSEIVDLAGKHDALVAVDDSHGHGAVGASGRGVAEHYGVDVDIATGTLGKAFGGAAGGFITGPAAVIEMMEQRSRPQLFSNALPPATAGGALAALKLIDADPGIMKKLHKNVEYLRDGLKKLEYDVLESPSAIVPIIIGDTAKALRLSEAMLEHDVLITGFGFPVVPEGTARLRAQVSAAHEQSHLDRALAAFEALRGELDK